MITLFSCRIIIFSGLGSILILLHLENVTLYVINASCITEISQKVSRYALKLPLPAPKIIVGK